MGVGAPGALGGKAGRGVPAAESTPAFAWRCMSERCFAAEDGTEWHVSAVVPGRATGRPPLLLPGEMMEGWLCFDSPGEKRRLYGIPRGWEECGVDRLRLLCREARRRPPASGSEPAARGTSMPNITAGGP
jgi:hypothetical protein